MDCPEGGHSEGLMVLFSIYLCAELLFLWPRSSRAPAADGGDVHNCRCYGTAAVVGAVAQGHARLCVFRGPLGRAEE